MRMRRLWHIYCTIEWSGNCGTPFGRSGVPPVPDVRIRQKNETRLARLRRTTSPGSFVGPQHPLGSVIRGIKDFTSFVGQDTSTLSEYLVEDPEHFADRN